MMTSHENFTPAFPDLLRDEVLHIETRRLWLRWPRPEDAETLAGIATVAACPRGEPRWPLDWSGEAEAAPRLVARLREANAAGRALMLGIAEKTSPAALVGLVGIDATRAGIPSLGFVLDIRRQGYGIMTEAVRALVGAAFLYGGLQRIRGSTAISGLGARRVLEKAGFEPVSPREPTMLPCSHLEARREQHSSGRGAIVAGGVADESGRRQHDACAA